MARHFLLWKLTGAKFNFESMFQQEWEPRAHDERMIPIDFQGHVGQKLRSWLTNVAFFIHVRTFLVENVMS